MITPIAGLIGVVFTTALLVANFSSSHPPVELIPMVAFIFILIDNHISSGK